LEEAEGEEVEEPEEETVMGEDWWKALFCTTDTTFKRGALVEWAVS